MSNFRIATRGQYAVTVTYSQEKVITVWANDEDDACDVAVAIVEKWDGVLSAEADEAEEI